MTDYTEYKLLDHLLLLTDFPMPVGKFLSLHTASPTDTGSLAAEVSTSGSGYARQTLAALMGATNVTTGVSVNTGTVTHGPATTDWGTITHIGHNDAVTAGTMLLWGAVEESQTTPIGESFQLTPGQYSIQFS
jgi:hypothetical protein